MKISIFGMGYVGSTTAACFLDDGHEVIAVDIDVLKINKLSKGEPPMIQEKGVEGSLYRGYRSGSLKATINSFEGVSKSDIIFICVGTPSDFDGSINLSYVKNVIKDIGISLKKTINRPLIVVRSTCLPGAMDNDIKPLLEESSGLIIGKDLDLVFHPEFLREGTAVDDFRNPPKIVVGESRGSASDRLFDIYKGYNAPCFKLSYGEAEMVKYCDNLFHALKITFANEVAIVANSLGVDSRIIADVYCSDTKLNISTAYLNPGFAYGGSCLPKDLRAILRLASLNYLQLPMLQGVIESNSKQIYNLIHRILSYGSSKVGMVGVAFKKGTNDVRESPYVKVAKSLIGEGIEVLIYDPLVKKECLIGSNKKQFYNNFKNIDGLLVSKLNDLSCADLIVINHDIVDKNIVLEWLSKGINIIDLVGIKGIERENEGYEGIYW